MKTYARTLRAHSRVSLTDTRIAEIMPVLREVMVHSAEDPGFILMKFYVDRATDEAFSISEYDTAAHRDYAMRDAGSDYRRQQLERINFVPVDARPLDVVASLSGEDDQEDDES